MCNKAFQAVIIFGCLISSIAYANDQRKIREYIRKNFPAEFVVNDAQISQLAWAFKHDKHTNDLDLRINDQKIYVEVSRALTRLYCAQLLRTGTRDAYNQLVYAQLQAGITDPLTFASFTKLSQHVQRLSATDYNLLETAAILSAVSLSKPAAELAQRAMDVKPVINDNMSFLAATLRKGINIYPLTAQVMRDNTVARKLLYILFPPQTNFRHMLYTEGGVGMFKYLRTMITHGFIDRESMDLWYAHWIVNISGFRGHVDQRGALYLHEPVAQAMLTLKDFVYEMLERPNYDPLLPYIEYRAKRLGFAHLSADDRLFFTHLGCLLRLYSITDGQKLYASVTRLPAHKLRAIKKYFIAGLRDPNQNTHMYVPALLGNALELTGGDLEQVVAQILPVYDAILQQAARQKITTSLSFNQLSASHIVKRLLIEDAAEPQRFEILDDGTILLLGKA